MRLDVGLDKVETVFHMADIHIRNLRRHREYREVFARLYDVIKKDTQNAIAIIAGDIAHAKLEMSPEQVDLTFEFLKQMSGILPTIVIAGNHDCNLANPTRLDVISPVIKNIHNKNLFYLKNSDVYEIADIKLSVMSIFDSPSKYITANKILGNNKIAVYHGIVNQAISDTGFRLHSEKIKMEIFDEFDMVILGDIHKHQYLNKEKTVGYCGSLMQQSFGEDLKHGILKWNIPNRESEFIEIKNDYGYVTLIVDSNSMPDISDLPSKARIRLMIRNTSVTQVAEIISKIRQKYPCIEEIIEMRVGDLIQSTSNQSKRIDIGDIRDINYQNQLIKEYLEKKYNIKEDLLNRIFELNEQMNLKLPERDIQRNIVWKPQSFEFSNMFSYGDHNKIDFTKLRGIVGLFGPNTYGKSNVIESLCFSIFDKSPRAWKAINVLNNKKSYFSSKLNFLIDDKEFVLKRLGKKNKNGDVNVDVNFYMKDDGDKISLNSDRRSSTNIVIRNYLGDFDDFSLTALMPQTDKNNFISMRQVDRKILLMRFLDLFVCQDLYNIANDEMKKISMVLQDFEKRDFGKDLAEISVLLARLEKEYENKNRIKNECDVLYKQINEEIKNLTKNLIKIDISITDIKRLESDLEQYIQLLPKKEMQLNDIKLSLQSLSVEKSGLINKINMIDSNIVDKYVMYQEMERSNDETQHTYDKYKIKLDAALKQLGDFGKLVFNPSCDSCTENENFIKSKVKTKEDIDRDKLVVRGFEEKLKNFETKLASEKETKEKYAEYNRLKEELLDMESKINLVQSNIIQSEKDFQLLNKKIEETKNNISLYHTNKQIIQKNFIVQTKIDDWESKLRMVETRINEVGQEVMSLNAQIEVNKEKQRKMDEEIDYVRELEKNYDAYKYYMESVERDGVPFQLISSVIPQIENEVNNILSQVVDFRIILSVDNEEKDIFAKISYGGTDIWPIELVSGMERFISSVALRVALLSITSLPRPNFLVVDEGFGSLDSDNANNLYRMLDYLKNQFDFVIVISHLYYVKDLVDISLEIQKENGFSKIIMD